MMTTRFCNKCAAEVPDHGGYCLLGHSLKVQSGITPALEFGPMADLESQLERTFEEASAEIAAAVAQVTDAPQQVEAAHEVEPPHEIEAPPAAPETTKIVTAIGKAFDERITVTGHDPIAAFAPPPRMDWGPERNPLRKHFSRRRRAVPQEVGG